mmetsp:Transcript_19208/g.49195  ORF Transcript_19208/g.49195 Transcript_19208/m.49195 type:complete len:449 (-) Transcript_19208:2236-3582(-)
MERERAGKRARVTEPQETDKFGSSEGAPPSFNPEFPGLQEETLGKERIFHYMKDRDMALQWLFQLLITGLRHENVWPSLDQQPLVQELKDVNAVLDAQKCDVHQIPKREQAARDLYWKKWSFFTEEKAFDFAHNPAVRASHLFVFTVCKMVVDVVDFAFLKEKNWNHGMIARTKAEEVYANILSVYGTFLEDGAMKEDQGDVPLTKASLGWCIRNIVVSCLAPKSIFTSQVTITGVFSVQEWEDMFDLLFQTSVPSQIEACHDRCPLHRRQGLGSPLLLILGEAFFSSSNPLSSMWAPGDIDCAMEHGRAYLNLFGMNHEDCITQYDIEIAFFDRLINFDLETEEDEEEEVEVTEEQLMYFGEKICFTLAHLHITPSQGMLFKFVKALSLDEKKKEIAIRSEQEKKSAAVREFVDKDKWLSFQKYGSFYNYKMRGYDITDIFSPLPDV